MSKTSIVTAYEIKSGKLAEYPGAESFQKEGRRSFLQEIAEQYPDVLAKDFFGRYRPIEEVIAEL